MMNIYYKTILKGRDLYSFLSGAIVSGFIVEIAMNTDNNWYHWGTILIGVLILALLYVQVKICANFDNNISSLKKSNIANRDDEAWKSINKEISANKVLKKLPKFWMKYLVPSAAILFAAGVFTLNGGNIENEKKASEEKAIENAELIKSIDKLTTKQSKLFESHTAKLEDSIRSSKRIIKIQTLTIDSLTVKLNALQKPRKKKTRKKVQK